MHPQQTRHEKAPGANFALLPTVLCVSVCVRVCLSLCVRQCVREFSDCLQSLLFDAATATASQSFLLSFR